MRKTIMTYFHVIFSHYRKSYVLDFLTDWRNAKYVDLMIFTLEEKSFASIAE